MSTPSTDPGLKLARQVAARVDDVVVKVTNVEGTVATLKKDVDALSAATRMNLKALIRTPPGQRGGAAEDDEEEFGGQPNWLEIEDPEEARTTLEASVAWHRRVLVPLDCGLPPCWPWHPAMVAEVLALGEVYVWAYGQKNPKEVGTFFAHYLATFRSRRTTHFSASSCSGNIHGFGARQYTVDTGALAEYARWWVSDRVGLPPGLLEREQ